VCFTYGTWFGVEALVALGETFENSPVTPLPRFRHNSAHKYFHVCFLCVGPLLARPFHVPVSLPVCPGLPAGLT